MEENVTVPWVSLGLTHVSMGSSVSKIIGKFNLKFISLITWSESVFGNVVCFSVETED